MVASFIGAHESPYSGYLTPDDPLARSQLGAAKQRTAKLQGLKFIIHGFSHDSAVMVEDDVY